MGLQELMLLVMIIFLFCSPATCALLSKNLIPGNMHEKTVNQSKYTTVVRGSGGGGRSTGDGGNENGNGDEPNSSQQGGGNGVVPVYAAGAASQRQNHKNGATTHTPCLTRGIVTLIVISISLFMYIPM
ncbi:hypothetical protein HanRHA438_Chr11g0481541 [Helianthus annuus]|nr:hypothetical protein HanRHA438_Chr11g0481541 [Helianthus annuus]